MTESNDKKNKLPIFKNLTEMNRYIFTEKYGAEKAERLMQEIAKLDKLHSEPADTHLNGAMERFGTEESGRMMLEVDAIGKFYLPPQGTKYNN